MVRLRLLVNAPSEDAKGTKFWAFLPLAKSAAGTPKWIRKYPTMDPNEFNHIIKPLLKWNRKTGQYQPVHKVYPCEYCPDLIKNQRIFCRPYLLGTDSAHLKHKCSCRKVIYDGSFKKNPWLLGPKCPPDSPDTK